MNSIDEKKAGSKEVKETKSKNKAQLTKELNKEEQVKKIATKKTTANRTTTNKATSDKTATNKTNKTSKAVKSDIDSETIKKVSTQKRKVDNTKKTNSLENKTDSKKNTTKKTNNKDTKTKDIKNSSIKKENNSDTKKEIEKIVPKKNSKKIDKAKEVKINFKNAKIDIDKLNRNSENEGKKNDNKEQLQEKIETVKDIKEIGQVLKEERKKKLPEDVQKKITTKTITNMIVGSVITLYLIFIILGFKNIEREVFITDLKVFSVSMIVISIILFENSYKKENKSLAIFGIEVLILAITNLALMYLYIMKKEIFMIAILSFTMVVILYYIIKSIVTFIKMKKAYCKENSELSEIIEEEV